MRAWWCLPVLAAVATGQGPTTTEFDSTTAEFDTAKTDRFNAIYSALFEQWSSSTQPPQGATPAPEAAEAAPPVAEEEEEEESETPAPESVEDAPLPEEEEESSGTQQPQATPAPEAAEAAPAVAEEEEATPAPEAAEAAPAEEEEEEEEESETSAPEAAEAAPATEEEEEESTEEEAQVSNDDSDSDNNNIINSNDSNNNSNNNEFMVMVSFGLSFGVANGNIVEGIRFEDYEEDLVLVAGLLAEEVVGDWGTNGTAVESVSVAPTGGGPCLLDLIGELPWRDRCESVSVLVGLRVVENATTVEGRFGAGVREAVRDGRLVELADESLTGSPVVVSVWSFVEDAAVPETTTNDSGEAETAPPEEPVVAIEEEEDNDEGEETVAVDPPVVEPSETVPETTAEDEDGRDSPAIATPGSYSSSNVGIVAALVVVVVLAVCVLGWILRRQRACANPSTVPTGKADVGEAPTGLEWQDSSTTQGTPKGDSETNHSSDEGGALVEPFSPNIENCETDNYNNIDERSICYSMAASPLASSVNRDGYRSSLSSMEQGTLGTLSPPKDFLVDPNASVISAYASEIVSPMRDTPMSMTNPLRKKIPLHRTSSGTGSVDMTGGFLRLAKDNEFMRVSSINTTATADLMSGLEVVRFEEDTLQRKPDDGEEAETPSKLTLEDLENAIHAGNWELLASPAATALATPTTTEKKQPGGPIDP